MKNRTLILLTVIVGCLLFSSAFGIALAQEATQEATPTFEPTQEPPTAEEITDTIDQSGLIVLTWQGFAALVVVLLGSGAGGVLVVVRMVRQNDVIKMALERLYLSSPPTTQEQIRLIVETILEGAKLADEVTDGVLIAQVEANRIAAGAQTVTKEDLAP